MEKRKNIHLLLTGKPSRLWEDEFGISRYGNESFFYTGCIWKNIYITSDEEIKEGYYLDLTHNIIMKSVFYPSSDKNCKKIIMTTDQDLIKNGVQSINDEFLKWFVKNPSCESIEVKLENYYASGALQPNLWQYKIIIPKEEPKQDLEKEMFELEEQLDIPSHLRWHNSKPKQETLEVKRNYEKHSLTKTKGYKLWCNIIQRCYNPKNHSYKYYGEKGVIMEDYFKNSYENFINWIKGIANYEKWLNSSELSLDRIDNTLGYVRGNIKFSTKTEQVENQNLRLDNKSGYKGVCYHKLNKKYGATITINKSKVFLGYYDTALEAALVYDNYVLKNNLNRKTNL